MQICNTIFTFKCAFFFKYKLELGLGKIEFSMRLLKKKQKQNTTKFAEICPLVSLVMLCLDFHASFRVYIFLFIMDLCDEMIVVSWVELRDQCTPVYHFKILLSFCCGTVG